MTVSAALARARELCAIVRDHNKLLASELAELRTLLPAMCAAVEAVMELCDQAESDVPLPFVSPMAHTKEIRAAIETAFETLTRQKK